MRLDLISISVADLLPRHLRVGPRAVKRDGDGGTKSDRSKQRNNNCGWLKRESSPFQLPRGKVFSLIKDFPSLTLCCDIAKRRHRLNFNCVDPLRFKQSRARMQDAPRLSTTRGSLASIIFLNRLLNFYLFNVRMGPLLYYFFLLLH